MRNDDNNNAFYSPVSNHGTALIAKQARKSEVMSKTPGRGGKKLIEIQTSIFETAMVKEH